jgi:hypothetical protein
MPSLREPTLKKRQGYSCGAFQQHIILWMQYSYAKKLAIYRFEKLACKWFESFLKGRTQKSKMKTKF